MKYTKGTFKIHVFSFRDGKKVIEVSGYIHPSGLFATDQRFPGDWFVTHIPTGLGAAHGLKRLRDAKRAIEIFVKQDGVDIVGEFGVATDSLTNAINIGRKQFYESAA